MQNPTLEPYPPGYNVNNRQRRPRPQPVENIAEQDLLEGARNPLPGTFEMVKFMARLRSDTCVTKHYTIDEWKEFRNDNLEIMCHVAIACKNSIGEFERIYDIINEVAEIRMISVSFDQGKFEDFQKLVENLKRAFPRKQIISAPSDTIQAQEKRSYARSSKQKNPIVRLAVPKNDEASLLHIKFY